MKRVIAAVVFVIGLFTLVFTVSFMNSLLLTAEAISSLDVSGMDPLLQNYLAGGKDYLVFGWIWAFLTAACSLITMWVGISNIRVRAKKIR